MSQLDKDPPHGPRMSTSQRPWKEGPEQSTFLELRGPSSKVGPTAQDLSKGCRERFPLGQVTLRPGRPCLCSLSPLVAGLPSAPSFFPGWGHPLGLWALVSRLPLLAGLHLSGQLVTRGVAGRTTGPKDGSIIIPRTRKQVLVWK